MAEPKRFELEVDGPTPPPSADDVALMLTSDHHFRSSEWLITVTAVVRQGAVVRVVEP